jgi:hypothetical protein
LPLAAASYAPLGGRPNDVSETSSFVFQLTQSVFG